MGAAHNTSHPRPRPPRCPQPSDKAAHAPAPAAPATGCLPPAALVVAVLLAAGAAPAGGQCNIASERTFFYPSTSQQTTYQAAINVCAGQGGFLASIANSAEQAAVNSRRCQFRPHGCQTPIWIGMRRPCSRAPCAWFWEDGTSVSFTNFDGPGEGSTTQEENVVAMWNNGGKWDSWGVFGGSFTHVTACIRRCTSSQFLQVSTQKCCQRQTCSSTQFVSGTAGPEQDITCLALRTCIPGAQFESRPPTASSDRVCSALTPPCGTNTFESKAPTPTSDRQCEMVRSCVAGEFEQQAPTPVSDRVCVAVTACFSSEFISVAATSTSDRICKRYTVCAEDQFESSPGDLRTDRTCSKLRACQPNVEFEATPPTATSNRVCAQLTPCSSGDFAVAPATATSDRTCQPCPAGTVAPLLPEDPCSPCPSGTFAGPGSVSCARCAAGKTDDDLDPSTPCIPCSTGTFTSGQGPCVLCQQTTDDDLDPSTPCTPCLPGSELPSTNAIGGVQGPCPPCAAGEFSALGLTCRPWLTCSFFGREIAPPTPTSDRVCSDSVEFCLQPVTVGSERRCQLCEPTRHITAATPARDECTLCAAGHGCDGVAQQPCPVGHASGAGSVGSCLACGVGTFQNETAQSSCLPCPAGTLSSMAGRPSCAAVKEGFKAIFPAADPTVGAVDELPCSAGSFCTGGVERPCSPGTSQGLSGQASCPDCGFGSFSGSVGATTCLAIPPRFQGTGGTNITRTALSPCDGGFACPGGGIVVPCPPGFFAAGQASQCTACDASQYQPAAMARFCLAIPGGFLGVGFGGDGVGSTNITSCPAGSFCVSGRLRACPTGSFAGPQSAACATCDLACPTGLTNSGDCNSATGQAVCNDETPPVLTLTGPAELVVEANADSLFEDPGVTAIDSFDGQLPVNVMGAVDRAAPGSYTLVYSARDATGLTTTGQRLVIVRDTVAPYLLLRGDPRVFLLTGDPAFAEPGYSALDDLDGDLTALVVVAGVPGTGAPARVNVTYSVVDRAGNAAEERRAVFVLDRNAELAAREAGNAAYWDAMGRTQANQAASESEALRAYRAAGGGLDDGLARPLLIQPLPSTSSSALGGGSLLILIIAAAAVALVVVGFLVYRRQRQHKTQTAPMEGPTTVPTWHNPLATMGRDGSLAANAGAPGQDYMELGDDFGFGVGSAETSTDSALGARQPTPHKPAGGSDGCGAGASGPSGTTPPMAFNVYEYGAGEAGDAGQGLYEYAGEAESASGATYEYAGEMGDGQGAYEEPASSHNRNSLGPIYAGAELPSDGAGAGAAGAEGYESVTTVADPYQTLTQHAVYVAAPSNGIAGDGGGGGYYSVPLEPGNATYATGPDSTAAGGKPEPGLSYETVADFPRSDSGSLPNPYASEPLTAAAASPPSKPAWRQDVSRTEATEMLQQEPQGSFVIRPSSRDNCLALTVKCSTDGRAKVWHGIIALDRAQGYKLQEGSIWYPSLRELVAACGTPEGAADGKLPCPLVDHSFA